MNTQANPELENLAERLYDYVCANRQDNLTKDGLPGDPRKVGCPYAELFEPAKRHYRSAVKWHLGQFVP